MTKEEAKRLESEAKVRIQLHYVNANCCGNCKWFEAFPKIEGSGAQWCVHPSMLDENRLPFLSTERNQVCSLHEMKEKDKED